MADLGEGPRGVGSPLFLDQTTEAQRAEKNFFETAPPLSQGLDTPPFIWRSGSTTVEAVQYRKWSPTAYDPQNGPQMILDRKWSLKPTANDPVKTWGMEWILWDWLQKRTDYKKRNVFLSPFKEKGKEDATSQVNLYKAKKKLNKSEKVWY